MTKNEIILILVAALAATWSGIISVYAFNQIKKAKAKVAYYQNPVTQMEIARHVIKNKWYTEGGEVFE